MAKAKWRIEREKARADLEASLLDNLEARGLVEDVYRDKVSEYMGLWDRLQDLRDDIKRRGDRSHGREARHDGGEPERELGGPSEPADAGHLCGAGLQGQGR